MSKPIPVHQTDGETIVSYKGFGVDWKCRDFQYKIGESYTHDGNVIACDSGFHACEYPLHVLRYYKAGSSRFAVVEQSGALSRQGGDSKVASRKITIKAEIDIAGLIKAAIKYTMDRCVPAEGAASAESNTAVSTSGDSGAATASGNYGAATASGYSGAATASGYYGKARGKKGCAIFLAERDDSRKIIHVWAGLVGKDDIKPDTFYRLENGKPVEVES